MIIAKFGGTSVATEKRILTLCNIIGAELLKKPVVVVSALSGVTDLLLSGGSISKIRKLHKKLIEGLWNDRKLQKKTLDFIDNQLKQVSVLRTVEEPNFNQESLDKIASYGEIMSSYIIAQALENKGIKATQVIATDLIITNNNFGSAEFLVGPTKKNTKKVLLPLVKNGIVPVVTGFIGSTKSGQITTLGRGGSDYSASIIGFCLKASEIQIWTDVDGIFTADPKIVKNAKHLPVVSFKEASELAAFGARILHPRTIRPAIKAGIPVKVLNTLSPKNYGTLIEEKSSSISTVKVVSFKRGIILVNIYATEMLFQKGFLARVFKVFANHGISVDLVSVSEVSVSITLDNKENLENAVKEISKFAAVTIFKDLGMVSLIGEGITLSSRTIKQVFEILDKEKILIKMISLSGANINISIVVESDKVENAVKALHNKLLLKQIIQNLPKNDTIAPKETK
ncbi:MAG: aspartate kinase [Candidatus Daviesbacteria bacterium]|nr:aspartate kinase [Candidatus Daviesbacteria bacterium]